VLLDQVTPYHKNHIFKQLLQPHKNRIFRANDSRFQSFGRPVLGTSRPMCTIVHRFVLAVDRHTCQSTALVGSSYGPDRSTRQSTDTWTPTLGQTQSTGRLNMSRPTWERFEFWPATVDSRSTVLLSQSTDTPTQSTVRSFLGQILLFISVDFFLVIRLCPWSKCCVLFPILHNSYYLTGYSPLTTPWHAIAFLALRFVN